MEHDCKGCRFFKVEKHEKSVDFFCDSMDRRIGWMEECFHPSV